ncbi:flagellar hook-associated protein FlgK [Cryobacterium tepidiphilum]|uniref:Flagellar hook-associated protein 1 n=1 Tax=Cryobacterium tepidiphilum TaxID=2486026 RepID=A0A3M8LMI1_9MICO|nr:flagellar hook-associated protein FlgK [Cryobacterium tepidiphilum]RNE66690.1 flagellar hook-associated protein FlgK [Cryobacterium tepidiphilum]
MSTFGGLSTAYSGLVAARQGLDVVGQNIANANTDGYTRQRVTTSAIGGSAQMGMFTGGVRVGQGVSVDGIERLGSANLDAQVRSTAGTSGYTAVRANALSSLETSLHEPGENGLSTQLQEFWAAWQDLSNAPGESAQSGLVLSQAGVLVTQIASGYQAVDSQWSEVRADLSGHVDELNNVASRVAELNGQIRSTLASGGNVNELLDQRGTLTTTIASLTGGALQERPDGTVDVLVGGNLLVSGTTAQRLTVTGSSRMDQAGAAPVRLQWASSPGTPVAIDGGEIAGGLSLLAASGPLAQAAASYNDFATQLAGQVNAIHQGGVSTTGATGLAFFGLDAALPAALGLSVIPTDASGIATGDPASGSQDGGVADAIAQLGATADSPNRTWASFVTSIGVATKSELQTASLADLAATSAVDRQLANSGVDLDEENVNMLMFQHAYQGAARVMTAVDEMLDTLINHTGLVGR